MMLCASFCVYGMNEGEKKQPMRRRSAEKWRSEQKQPKEPVQPHLVEHDDGLFACESQWLENGVRESERRCCAVCGVGAFSALLVLSLHHLS